MSTPARRLSRALVTLALLLGLAPALGVAPAEAATCRPAALTTPARIGGIARVHSSGTACASARTLSSTNPYSGIAPLAYHGGEVMGSAAGAGAPQVTVTPIFWAPAGYPASTAYRNVITQYLADLAADSGTAGNVFGTVTQYYGTSGYAGYHLTSGPTIVDTGGYPTHGCTVNGGPVYSDFSAYRTCLDDAQIQAKLASIVSSRHLPTGLGQLYLMFLPQGVESCFDPSTDTQDPQACTINADSSTSVYCGYHGSVPVSGPDIVYANLPFPVYATPTQNGSCTDEGLDPNNLGTIQSPNGDVDADVVLSTTSHEMAEAITDPFLDAWLSDSDGSENGDLCAYNYGTSLLGTAGHMYNQAIHGHHYLTQTEFSQAVYDQNQFACVPVEAPAAAPTTTSVSSSSGSSLGGRPVTITGTSFLSASQVTFGGVPAPFTVLSPTSISATTPPHAGGVSAIQVTNTGGTSPASGAPTYEFIQPPAVAAVTPRSGHTAGGENLTITGTAFTGASQVTFGSTAASSFVVQSDTSITAVTPPHTSGTLDIRVTGPGGVSATGAADRYRYGVASVSSVSPTANSTTAGHIVTVSGTGFTGATKVLFGSTGARFSVTSDSRITAITPAHAQATVNVIVVNGAGSSATSAGTRYLFLSAPRVTRVSPTGGSHRGGTTVTITGSNFLRVRAVHFGYTAASFTVNSSTRITVRTPVHATGSVNVLVFTPGGASAVSAADRYRFT